MTPHPTLIHVVTDNRWGGIQRYALDICSHFNEKGWQVFALTRGAKAVDHLFEKEGIPLINAPLEGFLDFYSIRLLKRKFDSCDGSVIVHAHGFNDVFIALIARRFSSNKNIRIIVTRHKVRLRKDNRFFRNIYKNIDTIVFVSRIVRDRFLESHGSYEFPIAPSKMFVVHNSIKHEISPYESPHAKGPIVAMFHGPLEAGKGLETIIDSMVMLKGKRIRLRIVGSGQPDYVDKIRRRAINRGVMDMIDWHKHTDDPLSLIASCDFGVLPSTIAEAFGLANIEYMAMGRPQICSSNGAQPEYITDGEEGILIPPGNPDFLADAILKLSADKTLREEMGKKAYETFNNRLSWPRFISEIERIYQSR